jgi:pyrimidine deaminase RibD-like protein
MRASDFRIVNHDKLDSILVRLCEMVVEGQRKDADRYGMVAAAVLDPDNNCVAALNYRVGDKDVHGERAAIDAYEHRFGDIPQGSIIITTCSPCTEPMPERVGSSCQDMISASPVHKVYAGYRDPSQQTSSGNKTYHLQITKNKKIQELCKAFADTWLDDDQLDESMFDQCYAQARKLYDQAESKGLNPMLVQVADYQGDGSHADPKWLEIPQRLWQHYVTVVGDIVYDPTAEQFGNKPTKYSVNDLKKLWAKQYQIQPKELNELSFLGSPCTKDCSGHRAGYAWSQSKGGRVAQSPFSPSFNNGSQLHMDGK